MKKFIACMLLIIIVASATFLGYRTAWFKDWTWFKTETSQSADNSSSIVDSSSNESSSSIENSSSSSNSSSSVEVLGSLNSLGLIEKDGISYYEISPNTSYTYSFSFVTDKIIGNDFSVKLKSYGGDFYVADLRRVTGSYNYFDYNNEPKLVSLSDFSSNFIKDLKISNNLVSFSVGEHEFEDYFESSEMGRNSNEWYYTNRFLHYYYGYNIVNDSSLLTKNDINVSHVANFGDTSTNVSILESCLNHNKNFLDKYYFTLEITDSYSGATTSVNLKLTQLLQTI